MRLTKKTKYKGHYKTKGMFFKLRDKLGQLEDIEELCTKMTTQPIYENYVDTDIYEYDFIGCNTAYDFKNNCIIVYKDINATMFFIDDYGITWSVNKEDLLGY